MIALGEVVGTIGRFACHRLVRICETAASVAVEWRWLQSHVIPPPTSTGGSFRGLLDDQSCAKLGCKRTKSIPMVWRVLRTVGESHGYRRTGDERHDESLACSAKAASWLPGSAVL